MNEHDLTILKITYYKLMFLYIFKIYIGITRQDGHHGLCVPLFFVTKTYQMKNEGSHTVTIRHVEKHFWYAVNDADLPNSCKLTEQCLFWRDSVCIEGAVSRELYRRTMYIFICSCKG